MPYISQDQRPKFDECIIAIPNIDHVGELNYLLTKIAKEYIRQKGVCYQTYNDIAGTFQNCYLELYRREISNYENQKIAENGDVY